MMNVFGQRSKSTNLMWLLEKQFRERNKKGAPGDVVVWSRSKKERGPR